MPWTDFQAVKKGADIYVTTPFQRGCVDTTKNALLPSLNANTRLPMKKLVSTVATIPSPTNSPYACTQAVYDPFTILVVQQSPIGN